jgi:putative transposase
MRDRRRFLRFLENLTKDRYFLFVPRFARVVVPECPHHVTQRGNGRRDVFFTDSDREVYLGLLHQYTALRGVDVLGYCLMTNHVHLILTPYVETALAKVMREVSMRYSQFRNAVEQSNGHLWQSRYYSCAVDPSRVPIVMRYVELNPVRAGLAGRAEDYRWSSAREHVTEGGATQSGGLLAVADWDQCWDAAEWATFLRSGRDSTAEIREATYGGRPFGSAKFVEDLERHLERKLTPGRPGRPRKAVGEVGSASAAKI